MLSFVPVLSQKSRCNKGRRKLGITATFLGGSAWDDREWFLSI